MENWLYGVYFKGSNDYIASFLTQEEATKLILSLEGGFMRYDYEAYLPSMENWLFGEEKH